MNQGPQYYYRARLIKDGPYVGVRVWFGPPLVDGEEIDRSWRWQCQVRTETTGRVVLMGDSVPIEVDGDVMLRNLEKIEEKDWRYLVQHAAWATEHAAHLPDASPRTPVDWNSTRSRF